MKQWSIPSKYRLLANLFVLPLCFDNRNRFIQFLDGNELIQKLLANLNAAPVIDISATYGTKGASLFENADERYRMSMIWNGRNAIQSMIGYVIIEQFLKLNMGNNPPSKFFATYPIANEVTEETAIEFCQKAWDIEAPLRAALFDWGIYIRINDIDTQVESYWYHADGQRWMKDLRTAMKLIFV